MSQVKLNIAIDEMRGEFAKDSKIIMRRKKFRAPNGAVLKRGVQEAYQVVNPRDYDRTPPQGAELANINLFKASKQRATEIIRSGRYTNDELAALTLAERTRILHLREQLTDYTRRFYAQFKRPDPEAPFEKHRDPDSMKLQRRQYAKLDNFIQAIEREKILKSQTPAAQ